MSDLFLSYVRFNDFRTFGTFETEIVPAPGLTLLVGTNGLGKSSFFDALEWGLTGEVRRFKGYMGAADQGKYLTRRGAPAGSHSVTLEFSDGSTIERGGQTNPSASEIIELLKKPEWTAQIEDIATYLAFTHFLGQAAQQRFTSRDRSEQWASLKGPSGIDRLDEVRNGLRGHATEMAFNRRIKREKEAIKEIERQLEEWRAFRLRLDRLRDAADAGGAMPTAEFEERLAILIAAVTTREPEYGDDSKAGSGSRLAAVGQALETLRRGVSSRKALMSSFADAPRRYAVQLAAASPDNPALAAATSASVASVAECAMATAATAAAREALADINSQLADVEAEIARLCAARSDKEAATLAADEVANANNELEAIKAELERSHVELKSIRAELAAIDDRSSTLARATAAMAQAERLATLAEGLPALRNRIAVSAAVVFQAEQEAGAARSQLPNLIRERDQISSELEAARDELEAARSRATAVAAAVAVVSSHVRDNDIDCPVCRTKFDFGQLRLLAEEAANAQDPALAAADARVANLDRNLHGHSQRIATAEAVLRAAEDSASRFNADKKELAGLERQLAAALPGTGDVVAEASEAQRLASESLSLVQAATAGDQPRRAEANVRAAMLGADVSRLETAMAAQQKRATAHASVRRSALERLSAAGFSEADIGRIDTVIEDRRTRRAQVIAQRATAEEELRRALEAEASARAREEEADEMARTLSVSREAALAGARALELSWRKAGLEGAPDATTLEIALYSLTKAAQEVDQLKDEFSSLSRAYERIVTDRELQDLMANMVRVGGEGSAEDPEPYEVELGVRLEAAKEALKTTDTAHRAVGAFADKLRDEAKSFSNRFLTPLNGLIDDFNEALLSTPSERVQLNATYHKDRTQFDMGLHYRDKLDDALYDTKLPPQVVLSEGQLAANGFSILCAASTAYPWSRWRALLMDDPLQHNDIIHAAAFVDLMRNLVELQQYQLVMSSHDRGEAEFIRRKFDAAGLPCSVIGLTAPSRSGVRYLTPEHNGSARNVLAGRLAQSA